MRSCSILIDYILFLCSSFVVFHGNIYNSVLVLRRVTGAVIHCAVVIRLFDRHLLTSLFFGWFLGGLCMCRTCKMLHCILVFLSLYIITFLVSYFIKIVCMWAPGLLYIKEIPAPVNFLDMC